ncbi:hypothetical protein BH09VER1_BH09VER1_50880 [soil metagenome]
MNWRVFLLAFILPQGIWAGLPTIKAVVGEPVVQALMGGCSLRCAFPWETKFVVPGQGAVVTYDLDDSYAASAWIDPHAGPGTKLTMQFPKKLPAEYKDNIPFYGFDIANGKVKPVEEFKRYARVKRLRMSYNGKAVCEIALADSWKWQHVTFDDIMANQGDEVTFEILETYPGTAFPNVAITEFLLQGAH